MDPACLQVSVSVPDRAYEDTIYALLGGVKVGAAGELVIVASKDAETDKPDDFFIYAPGQWRRVSVNRVDT